MTRPAAMILAALACVASPVHAGEEIVTYPTESDFDGALFGVESAIVDRGLVIDYVSHVGDMLARTGPDVGSDVALFDGAQIFLFCSAKVSREVMEDDPLNLGHCPYGIFVADREGEVVIGHRTYPAGAMQKVQNLLAEIAAEAAAF